MPREEQYAYTVADGATGAWAGEAGNVAVWDGGAWRFVEAAYLSEPLAGGARGAEAPLSMLAVSWLLVAACIWFGFDTSFTVEGARRAALLMLGGAP